MTLFNDYIRQRFTYSLSTRNAKVVADTIIVFFFYFSEKISLEISCESSAWKCSDSCSLTNKKKYTVKPVLVVTTIKQPTCIKQPEEICPKIHRLIYLNCIKQPPAFSSHILSFPWVAA